MKKLSLFFGTCILLVAFSALSAPAFADHIIEADCDGDPYDNSFALHGLEITAIDSDLAGEVSGINGRAAACGTTLHNSFFNCGVSPIGQDTLNNNANVETAPGVEINELDPATNPDLEVGDFVGYAVVNVASCLASFLAGIHENIGSEMRVDSLDECERENRDMVGGPKPGTVITCYKGVDVTSAVSLGHNWNWTTLHNGRNTLTIGPFHPAIGSAGITKIQTFTLCGYVGTSSDNTVPCRNDSSRPWMQKNGDASAPDCRGGAGPEGIYTGTVTNNRGDESPAATACVSLRKVDPDCDGTPYNNDFTINRFAVDTPLNHSADAYSKLVSSFLVCGTALGSGNSNNGSDTLIDHIDFMNALGSNTKNTLGYQPIGSFAGRIEGSVAYHDNDHNPVIEGTTATLRVDPLDLRFLDWPMTSNDDCNREAEDGLVGNNVGTTGEWIPGRPASVIFVCLRADGVTDSGLVWHSWVWEIISAELESPGGNAGATGGRRIITMGPIHMQGDSTAERPAGFTNISEFSICGNVGAVGGTGCGSYRDGDDKLHKNGDSSDPDCSNGNGIFTVRATMKNGDKTTPLIPINGSPISDCVVWTDGRGGDYTDCVFSTKATCGEVRKPKLGGKRLKSGSGGRIGDRR